MAWALPQQVSAALAKFGSPLLQTVGDLSMTTADLPELVAQIKADFANYGRKMAELRKSLEDWTEFVNPYQRIRSSVKSLRRELDALQLRPEDEAIPDITSAEQAIETARSVFQCVFQEVDRGWTFPSQEGQTPPAP